MSRSDGLAALVLVLIVGSYFVIWPAEVVAATLLLLAVRFLAPEQRRDRLLLCLAGLVIAAGADRFVLSALDSAALMIGRHVGALLMLIAVFWKRQEPADDEAAPPPKRGRLLKYPIGIVCVAVFAGVFTWDTFYIRTMALLEARKVYDAMDLVGLRPDAVPAVLMPEPAIMAMLDLSRHPDLVLRADMAYALGYVAKREGPRGMIEPPLTEKKWWEDEYWNGKSSPNVDAVMPRLIELLDDSELKVRMNTLRGFEEIGPKGLPAVPALRRLLQQAKKGHDADTASSIRASVAGSFWHMGPGARDAIPDLLALLADETYVADRFGLAIYGRTVQEYAAGALGQMGPFAREAIPTLEKAASATGSHEMRDASAWALWMIQPDHPLVRPVLLDVLKRGDSEVKARAAYHIAEVGPESVAIPALIPLSTSEDPRVQTAAIRALCEIGAGSTAAVEAVLAAVGTDYRLPSEIRDPLWQLEREVRGAAKEAMAARLEAFRAHRAAQSRPTDPEAQKILDRTIAVYAECTTYRDSGTMLDDYITTRERRRTELQFKTAFVRPDRFRFEHMGVDGDRYIVWSHDQDVRSWRTHEGERRPESLVRALYTVNSDTVDLLLPGKTKPYSWLQTLENLQRLEDAVFESVACLRVQGRLDGAEKTIWIDQRTLLIRRIDDRLRLSGGDRMETTTTYDPMIDEPLADELLEFDPADE